VPPLSCTILTWARRWANAVYSVGPPVVHSPELNTGFIPDARHRRRLRVEANQTRGVERTKERGHLESPTVLLAVLSACRALIHASGFYWVLKPSEYEVQL